MHFYSGQNRNFRHNMLPSGTWNFDDNFLAVQNRFFSHQNHFHFLGLCLTRQKVVLHFYSLKTLKIRWQGGFRMLKIHVSYTVTVKSDPFKVLPNSLQKANLTTIGILVSHRRRLMINVCECYCAPFLT